MLHMKPCLSLPFLLAALTRCVEACMILVSWLGGTWDSPLQPSPQDTIYFKLEFQRAGHYPEIGGRGCPFSREQLNPDASKALDIAFPPSPPRPTFIQSNRSWCWDIKEALPSRQNNDQSGYLPTLIGAAGCVCTPPHCAHHNHHCRSWLFEPTQKRLCTYSSKAMNSLGSH